MEQLGLLPQCYPWAGCLAQVYEGNRGHGAVGPLLQPLRLPTVSGDVENSSLFLFHRRSSLRYFILHFPEITWQSNRVGGAA